MLHITHYLAMFNWRFIAQSVIIVDKWPIYTRG